MKKLFQSFIVLVVLLAVVQAISALYKLKYPTYTYRYRMILEVNAGGEIRSGSTVIEVKVSRQPQFLPEVRPFDYRARGQAAFVELPGGKNIVALLASGAEGEHGDYAVDIIQRVFQVSVEALPSLRGRRDLPIDQMPTLVTVANPSDVTTAKVVTPDVLDTLLGVRLRSFSVETTTDEVTAINLDSRLPFLVDEEKNRLEYRFPRYSSFIRR